VGVLVVTGPWLARNHRLFDAPRMNTVQGWGLVWEGIGEYPNALGATPHDADLYAHQSAHGFTPITPEADAFVGGEVRDYVREHPGEFAGIVGRRLGRILLLQGGAWSVTGADGTVRPGRAGLLLYRLAFAALVLLGAWRLRGTWRGAFLVLVVPAAMALPQMLIVLEPRHLVPATAPLFVFVGAAVAYVAASRSRTEG
jgi:hypothetical protein